MSTNYSGPGFWYVPAYQTSALPWLKDSLSTSTDVAKVTFPKVTKYIKVRAVTQELRVGFTELGVASSSHYFTVPTNQVVEFDVRVKEMFYATASGAGSCHIFAGLTLIDSRNMSHLTSSTEFTGSVMGAGWQGVG